MSLTDEFDNPWSEEFAYSPSETSAPSDFVATVAISLIKSPPKKKNSLLPSSPTSLSPSANVTPDDTDEEEDANINDDDEVEDANIHDDEELGEETPQNPNNCEQNNTMIIIDPVDNETSDQNPLLITTISESSTDTFQYPGPTERRVNGRKRLLTGEKRP